MIIFPSFQNPCLNSLKMDRRPRALALMRNSPAVCMLNLLLTNISQHPPSDFAEDNDLHELVQNCSLRVSQLVDILTLLQDILERAQDEPGLKLEIIEVRKLRALLEILDSADNAIDPDGNLDAFFFS